VLYRALSCFIVLYRALSCLRERDLTPEKWT
jgi:hypothetical protein